MPLQEADVRVALHRLLATYRYAPHMSRNGKWVGEMNNRIKALCDAVGIHFEPDLMVCEKWLKGEVCQCEWCKPRTDTR